MLHVSIVAAVSSTWGIGNAGSLPWSLKGDKEYFKTLTTKTSNPMKKNAVIMGRLTWESIPERLRPLPGRMNIVITRGCKEFPGAVSACSLSNAFRYLDANASAIEKAFVIGGAELYNEAMAHCRVKMAYITHVSTTCECDRYIRNVLDFGFRPVVSQPSNEENGLFYRFVMYEKNAKPHEELQYLDLCKKILETGVKRTDRTMIGTSSVFGASMRFDLRNNTIPLLTTKRVFWKGVVEELLWFISGNTSASLLSERGVKIWDANGSREFLDSIGLEDREVGDLGPVYGFQWRHFGAEYVTMHEDYHGKGIDQLRRVIDMIKTEPDSRRIILSAWNPTDLSKMALPPCHLLCQFYVQSGELSCQMYQRSADMGLGVPFNIASYSLLTHMIAHVCNLKAREFIHVIGDAHIYSTHTSAIQEQLLRSPVEFPKLHIEPSVKDIEALSAVHLTLENYNPAPTIKMSMAV